MMKGKMKRWISAVLCAGLLFTNLGVEQLTYAASAEEQAGVEEADIAEDIENPEEDAENEDVSETVPAHNEEPEEEYPEDETPVSDGEEESDGAEITLDADGNIASGSVDINGHIDWVIDANGKLTVTGTGELSERTGVIDRMPWFSSRERILSAEISITGITDASELFDGCKNLKNVDLSNFDTGNVSKMNYMFCGCSSLSSLDVSNFDTGNVSNMNSMFLGCSSLSGLDVSNFDTRNVGDMGFMFRGCSSLSSLDLSNFNTKNVSNMNCMFYACNSLRVLAVSNFDTGNVSNMNCMFFGCSSLSGLAVSNFDTRNVSDMGGMFKGCSSLSSLDVSNFDTRNVSEMHNMFFGCHSLSGLAVSNFDTKNVKDMGYMFSECHSLSGLDVSNFDTKNVKDMGYMFYGCSSLKGLAVSNFDTKNVIYMDSMFLGCSSLNSLEISNFDTRNVKRINSMFLECSSLTSLDLSSLDLSNCNSAISAFYACTNLSTIYTPYNLHVPVELPAEPGDIWHCSNGTIVTELPKSLSHSVVLGKNYIPEEKTVESPVIELKDGENAVFVYDVSTTLPIAGALVTVDGNVYTTNTEGVAACPVFSKASKKQILINASGYQSVTTYQYIKNKSLVRIGMKPDADALQLVSANASLEEMNYDLLREKLVLGYAEKTDDFINVKTTALKLSVRANKGKVTYKILSSPDNLSESGGGSAWGDADAKVLFTSSDGEFSITVTTETVKLGAKEIAQTAVTDMMKPEENLFIMVTDENGNSIIKKLNIFTTYNYLTQEKTKQKDNFKLGDKLKVSVPDDVPFIGGNDYVFGFDDEMPVEVEIDEDGKIKIAYNKPADIDMEKFCKNYKDLEKKYKDLDNKAGRVAKWNSTVSGVKKFSAGLADLSAKICGYGEGNINEIANGNPTIKLALMYEIEGEYGYKHYWVIGLVPVKLFVEVKGTGSAKGVAEIKFENWKIKEIDLSGGSFNVTIQLEVGGGIGFGYEVEASLTGKINYTNKPDRNYEKLWLEASGKVKRILFGTWEKIFWESDEYKYTLYQKGTDLSKAFELPVDAETGTQELRLTNRKYLNYTDGFHVLADAMGIMAYSDEAEDTNTIIKSAVFPAASPRLLETDHGMYLFWLDDIASRDDYNRTALMYAKSLDGVSWSMPVRLLSESEDNTLDGSYDAFTDGKKIYLLWQDAGRQMSEKDTALDALKSLSVRTAVLDTAEDVVTESKCLTQETGYYMYPCVVAKGGRIYFAYVRNMLDTGNIDGKNTQHLYVGTGESGTKEIAIPYKAQIANMDAGVFAGRPGLICEVDTDGDASTDEDREMYLYDFQSDHLTRITDNRVSDTMPVIADSGNIYWFQGADLVRLSRAGEAPRAIWNEQKMAYQMLYTVVTDASGRDSILWESVDTDAEDGSVAIFQTSENSDGSWGDVVKFAETTGTISSRISVAGSGKNMLAAHTEGVFLQDGTELKDLCVTAKKEVVDTALEYVDYDEENAAAGNPLILKAGIINKGSIPVDEIAVSVDNTVITTLKGLNLKPSESRELEIAGFNVPSSLKEPENFALKITASAEKNQEDNTFDLLLGCPDVYVAAGHRIAEERTWLDIDIWNDTAYEASGEILVHKNAENGEVIYRKAYEGLSAGSGYAYSVDLGDYEDKNVKYYVEATSDVRESNLGNNTEFVYIGYGTGVVEEEAEENVQAVQSISLAPDKLSLDIGDTSKLIVKDDRANILGRGELLWSSSDSRIASVDQEGLVKAHRSGQAKITAYYGELSCSCAVTVGGEAETQALTVWFDTQGGERIASVTGIVPGSIINLPSDVKRQGYIFEGWYTQPVNGEKIDSTTLLVEQSMTLYAHWTKIQSENGLWVADIADQIYTGKAIKPRIKVYDGRTLLKEKTDYTITYKNNVKASDASNKKSAPMVMVKGKGNYFGKETVTFKILSVDLNADDVIKSDITAAYNEKIQKKVPVLTFHGKKLLNNKDFTVTYPDKGADAYKEEGSYNVVLAGKGNFTGTLTLKLDITNKTLLSKATVAKIPNQPYDGKEKTPSLTVTMKGTPLTEGTDYTVRYENNTEAGTARAVLTGIGEHYAGTKKVTFKITGTPLKGAVVTGMEGKTYTYDGTEHEPGLTVTLDGKLLTKGTDYKVSYSNNVNAGKATVTVQGIHAYTGTIKKTFRISAYDLNDQEIRIEGPEQKVKYVKGGSKPEIKLTFADRKLTEGKDYKLSYQNNKAVTASGTVKRPMLIIKGKGNFRGTLTKEFSIISKVLCDEESPVTLSVADIAYVDKAGKYISKPVLTDADGKRLTAGKDYESAVTYALENGKVLTDEDTVDAGVNIRVKVVGKGAYYGELETVYRVTKSDFNQAKITIPAQAYTGKEITLSEKDIIVKIGNSTLAPGTDYEIVKGSYKNNIKKGTATVKVVGKGNYGGTKTIKFKIASKKFVWFWRLF